MQEFNIGDSVKLGYAIGDHFFEVSGIVSETTNDYVTLLDSDGNEVSIKKSFIVVSSKTHFTTKSTSTNSVDSNSTHDTTPEITNPISNTNAEDSKTPSKEHESSKPNQESSAFSVKEYDPAAIKNNLSGKVDPEYPYPSFSFEKKLDEIGFISDTDKEYLITMFNSRNYYEVTLSLLDNYNNHKGDAPLATLIWYLIDVIERKEKNDRLPDAQKINTSNNLGMGFYSYQIEQDSEKALAYFLKALDSREQPMKTVIYRILVSYDNLRWTEEEYEFAKRAIELTDQIEPPFDRANPLKIILTNLQDNNDWDNYVLALRKYDSATITHPVSHYNNMMKLISPLVLHERERDAEEFYFHLLELDYDSERISKVLLEILKIEKKYHTNENISQKIEEHLHNDISIAAWREIAQKENFISVKNDETTTSSNRDESSINLGSSSPSNDDISEKYKKRRTKNEVSFQNLITSGRSIAAVIKFKKDQKKYPDDAEIKEIYSRAGLVCHYENLIKDKEELSDCYDRALDTWVNKKDPIAAEKMLLAGIGNGDIEDKNKALTTIIDIEAIRFGFLYGIHCVDLLRNRVLDNDRFLLTSLYVKRSWMASIIGNYEEKIYSLNILQSLFVDRKRIAKNYFELGECYQNIGNKNQAIANYQSAMQYGYAHDLCEQRISECEVINGGRPSEIVSSEINIEEEKSIVEDFFKDNNYEEAHSYTESLLSQNPDSKEVQGLNEYTQKVLLNLAEYGGLLSVEKDNQLRTDFIKAWRIENNYKKAESLAKSYAKKSIYAMSYKPLMLVYKFVYEVHGEKEFFKYENKTAGKIQGILHGRFISSGKPNGETLVLNSTISYYRIVNRFYIQLDLPEKIIESYKKLEHYYSVSKDEKRKNRLPDIHYKIGYTYYRHQQYQDAIKFLKQSYSEKYMTPDLCSYIVYTYLALDKQQDAIDFITKNLNDESIRQNTTIAALLESLLSSISDSGKKNILPNPSTDSVPESQAHIYSGATDNFEQYFLGTCTFSGIPRNNIENDEYDEDDLENLLAKIKRDILPYETRKYSNFYLSAAYIENKLNGRDIKFFDFISKSALNKALLLQGIGEFDSAFAYYLYTLEVMPKQVQENNNKGSINKFIVKNALTALLKKKPTLEIKAPVSDEEIVSIFMQLMNNSIDELGEYTYNELLLLFMDSAAFRELLNSSSSKPSYGDIWVRQLSNYIGGENTSETSPSINILYENIDNRKHSDINHIRDIVQRIKTTGAFDGELLNDLRDLRRNLFVCETDIEYINALVNAFEKGISINDYNDYENRVSTLYSQLNKLRDAINERVTYFSANYLQELIEEQLNILNHLKNKANKELGPELTVVIPVTDIPVIDDIQDVSLTIYNKENSANAKNVKIQVLGADGQILVDEFLIAQYIKGGRSVSREIDIEPQGDTYTISVLITYDGIDDQKIVMNPVQFSISSGVEDFQPIISPYYTGDSIDVKHKEVFVGRSELLVELENAIREDKSRCEIIYGQKRCGKSSIANFLVDELKTDFITIYFSIGGIREAKNIYREIKENIYSYLEDFIEENGESEKINEALLDKIDDQDVSNGDDFIYFMRWIKRRVCKFFGKELLLVIDEFTHMYRHINEEREELTVFMDNWKKLIEEDVFKSVLIGQDTMPNFIKEFPNQFMVTKMVRVDRLDDDSVRELIEQPLLLPNGESRFMENSVSLISSWFYGQPFYIQTYCDLLVSQMNRDHKVRITNALAEKVKEKMLEDSEEVLFNNLISRGDFSGTEQDCFEILKEIASLTRNSEWAEIKDLSSKNKSELLSDLKNRQVVKIQGDKCKILIDFFKEWLNRN